VLRALAGHDAANPPMVRTATPPVPSESEGIDAVAAFLTEVERIANNVDPA
jgi:hypothetical protein